MKVTRNMINPQLRLSAFLFGWLNKNLSEKKLRKNAGKPSLIIKLVAALTRPKNALVEERFLPRADGSSLRILIIRSPGQQPDATGLLWIHGGGYFMGSPEAEAGAANFFIHQCNSVVISPDYRLSVEAPYPAALDDCYLTLCWMKQHAAELGLRDDQLAVAGCSAGGGLTAALSLYARDQGEVNIAFQMPIYPMIDDRMQTESATENNAPIWNSDCNRVGWKLYLGDLYQTENVPIYAAPSRAPDLSRLPPTCTYVGAIEPFRDETIEYAERLSAAGVPVEYKVFDGCFHGFDGFAPNADVSKQAIAFRNTWYKQAVSQYFAPQRS